jgi:hypothetical protein
MVVLRELREDLAELWRDAEPFERVVIAICLPALLLAWVIAFIIHD